MKISPQVEKDRNSEFTLDLAVWVVLAMEVLLEGRQGGLSGSCWPRMAGVKGFSEGG